MTPDPKTKPKVKKTEIVNTTHWPTKEFLPLVRHVLKTYKRNHKFEPLRKIELTYHKRYQSGRRFTFWYSDGRVMIRIRKDIKFPVEYMGCLLPEWKDLFIMCFAWCAWHRVKTKHGRGSNEVPKNWAKHFATRWRIDTMEIDVLMDKFDGL